MRFLDFMTNDIATKYNIDNRTRYVGFKSGKSNMGPTGKVDWLHIVLERCPAVKM